MAIMKQGQSKRAQALEQQAKDQGIEWLGRDGGTWTMVGRKGSVRHRTIGGMKALLDSHEHSFVTKVGDDPDPHRSIVADHYVLSPIDPDGKPRQLAPRTPDDDEDDDNELPVLVGPNAYSEPFTAGSEELYLAQVGDFVRIDARTENEIQGRVAKVDGDLVTVHASKVILRGLPRPDFVGFVYFPYQNGTERPWGLTNCLEKM